MLIIRKGLHLFLFACAAIFLSVIVSTGEAQTTGQDSFNHSDHPRIKSFSVETPDITLAYPNTVDLDLPDEHTTLQLIRPWWHPSEERDEETYLMFGSSKVSATGTGGAVALETTDLTHFDSAANRGYPGQLMFPPVPLNMCDGIHDQEFDENYA